MTIKIKIKGRVRCTYFVHQNGMPVTCNTTVIHSERATCTLQSQSLKFPENGAIRIYFTFYCSQYYKCEQ